MATTVLWPFPFQNRFDSACMGFYKNQARQVPGDFDKIISHKNAQDSQI
jgi:hypothetical protein